MAISDTRPEAAAVQLEIFRRMGPEGRLRAACSASRFTRSLFENNVRAHHPEMSDRDITREVVRLLYGVVLPR